MRRLFAILTLVLVLPWPVWACLWDSDTLATEAKGLPEVVRVITGRFERNPPLYYELRLKRVSAELASDPTNLDAYDDAGVACDRLGRGDEAIAWMERKRAQLEGRDRRYVNVENHWYRYYANVGTFWVHRWFKNGADRAKIDEVKTARDFIAKAIELNPDAHFGREKYQLLALEWIIEPPTVPASGPLPAFVVFDGDPEKIDPKVQQQRAAEAVRGLSGLIALGNAWESVDVFNALSQALEYDGDRSSLAFLARLRCRELIRSGKRSMLSGAPAAADELMKRIDYPVETVVGGLHDEVKVILGDAYVKLRAEADAWHQARTDYMMVRLRAGRHPDSDPAFWSAYNDPGPPPLPNTQGAARRGVKTTWAMIFTNVAAFGLLLGGGFLAARSVWRMLYARRGKPVAGLDPDGPEIGYPVANNVDPSATTQAR